MNDLTDLAELRRELAQCQDRLASALDDVVRAERALAASHDRYLELAARADAMASARARAAESELTALMSTKSYRLLRLPRLAWTRLRNKTTA